MMRIRPFIATSRQPAGALTGCRDRTSASRAAPDPPSARGAGTTTRSCDSTASGLARAAARRVPGTGHAPGSIGSRGPATAGPAGRAAPHQQPADHRRSPRREEGQARPARVLPRTQSAPAPDARPTQIRRPPGASAQRLASRSPACTVTGCAGRRDHRLAASRHGRRPAAPRRDAHDRRRFARPGYFRAIRSPRQRPALGQTQLRSFLPAARMRSTANPPPSQRREVANTPHARPGRISTPRKRQRSGQGAICQICCAATATTDAAREVPHQWSGAARR